MKATNLNPASAATPIGSLCELIDAKGWPGTARVIAGPHPAAPGHVWIREIGLHMVAGIPPFVCQFEYARVRIVEA